MRIRLISLFFALAMLATGLVGPRSAEAQTSGGLAVTGTVDSGGTFAGVASDLAFAVQGGQIVLAGQLTGVISHEDGSTAAVDQAFAVVVSVAAGGECGVLVVDVAAIVVAAAATGTDTEIMLDALVLTSVTSGSGGLLGGLLGGTTCEVFSLLERLDSPLKLRRLVTTLNNALDHSGR